MNLMENKIQKLVFGINALKGLIVQKNLENVLIQKSNVTLLL